MLKQPTGISLPCFGDHPPPPSRKKDGGVGGRMQEDALRLELGC